MSPKELEEYYKRLTRKGQATLKVIFKASSDSGASATPTGPFVGHRTLATSQWSGRWPCGP